MHTDHSDNATGNYSQFIATALIVISSVIHQNDVIMWNSHSWEGPDSLLAPSLSPYEQTSGTDNDRNIYK